MAELLPIRSVPPEVAGQVSLVDFVQFWNKRQHLGLPALHREILAWLEQNWLEGKRELLLLVFRDAGKSTLVGLFAAWLLLRDPSLRILVLAAEQALARKMVRNVKRIIERHPLTISLRPMRRDQWAADQFTVQRAKEWRDPSMLARGLNGNITGCRADIVLCDDVEVPATCDTPAKREELRARLAEIDYVLVPDGTQLYIGTPHSYYSIYALEPRHEVNEEAPFLAGFQRLVLPALDINGQSRWPERFSRERLEVIRRRTGPARFAAQMLLQPTSAEDGRLDPNMIAGYRDELAIEVLSGDRLRIEIGGKRMVSASCWWDPSFGSPRKGDGSVIAAVFADGEGGYWLHRIAWLQQDPRDPADAATQLCRQAAEFAKALYLPAIRLETNGLGKFLPGLLRRALAEAECGSGVIECTSRKAKAVRILEAFDAVLAAGALKAHDSVARTSFFAEMREWRPGHQGRSSLGRDDGLDAVAGCLLSEPVRLGVAPSRHGRPNWRLGGETHIAPNDFEP
ncbi:phage terminase large subunit [Ferrovibrio sp.]|uniref:phage terminase large subunit n=1 Tax=Ferrovibrio sp. TaxID=1917215 RepID=UPI0026095FC6|nr:phage terminase large subunit [Ferrovibrio sp.]